MNLLGNALLGTAALWDVLPWLVAMVILIGLSAFFSASEAALFSLRAADRRTMRTGSTAEQAVAELLSQPERLLSSVLFWNLVVNISYFAIASIVSLRLQSNKVASLAFAIGSLIAVIFFSEMLPKSMAVLRARQLSSLVSVPLSFATRIVDPIMPSLRAVNLVSRRLLFPRFEEQPYLEISDIERALSTKPVEIPDQDQLFLRNIVALSELPVREWMRPRTQFRPFSSPVSINDLGGRIPPSGYLLITEPNSEEIAKALRLDDLYEFDPDHLDDTADPVVYVPWCVSVAEVLQNFRHNRAEVAVIVNERGESIGVVTREDVLAAIFTDDPNRGERMLSRNPIQRMARDSWEVAGMTNLRSIAKRLDVPGLLELDSRNVTIGGVVQENLERLPEIGDECRVGPFLVTVLATEDEDQGDLLLRLQLLPESKSEA